MNLFFQPKTIIYHPTPIKSNQIGQIISKWPNILDPLTELITITANSNDLIVEIKEDLDIKPEGYHLILDEDRATITSSSESGAFYGVLMLDELLKNFQVTTLEVSDYPDLPIRGVMLDISRSKVLTLETAKELVRLFARLRYNHLELYVEGFSFEYQSFQKYLNEQNYFSLHDYLKLEKYANKFYLDFVPNQNGFGHMSDWLILDEFKDLAECPDGFDIWGSHRMPSTLNPLDDKAVKLVKKMYHDMLPYTKSKYFNMDFDEPYELGHGKSKDETKKSSIEDVYIDYFLKLYEDVKSYHKTPMIWGDVLVRHPDKIDRLPKDVIFIDWGYNKDYDFLNHAKMLQNKKVKYLLAPGTSTWSTITGRMLDMESTIYNSATSAKKYGGLGIIVTDWGDIGHLQYLPFSYLGFIFAGMISWHDTNINNAKAYLKKMLNDDYLYEAYLELARYHMLEGEYRDYGSRLFNAILWAEHAKNQTSPLQFYLTRMKSNLLDEKNQQLLKISFTKVQSLLSLSKDSLIKEEFVNSLFLLETLLKINQKLKEVIDNKINKVNKINFDLEITSLKQYALKHQELWNQRNNPSGYIKSVNRINWLIEILRELTRKENA